MEPEHGVYERANEDLVQLLDSLGDKGSSTTSTTTTDARTERRRMLKTRGSLHWLEELAGALGLESIETLYDADDVETALQQRLRRASDTRTRRQRRSASAQRALDEAARLRRETAALGEEQRAWAAAERFRALSDALPPTATLEALLEARVDLGVLEAGAPPVLTVRTLWARFLDHTQHGRLAELLGAVEELAGTETVELARLADFWDARGYRTMAEHGCRLAYPEAGEYATLIARYLFARTPQELAQVKQDKHLVLDVGITGPGGHDAGVHGHPPHLMRLLRRVLDTERALDEHALQRVLLAHFLWAYFARATPERLAADWRAWGLALGRQSLQLDALDALVARLKAPEAPLATHCTRVLQALAQLPRVDDAPLFVVPFQVPAHAGLDALSALVPDAAALVVQARMRATLLEHQAQALTRYGQLGQPVLGVALLLPLFFHFARDYARHLERRARELAEALRGVDEASDPEEEVEEEEDEDEEDESNDLQLRYTPAVRHAVELAYSRVQLSCPALRGLPRAEYQTQQAHDTGLLLAFVRLVAALGSEARLFQRYLPAHQRRHTLLHARDCVQALKRYAFVRLGPARYRVRLAVDHGARRQQRRWL